MIYPNTGTQPVPDDVEVIVMFRRPISKGKPAKPMPAGKLDWGFNRPGFGPNAGSDIVRWRYADPKQDRGFVEQDMAA